MHPTTWARPGLGLIVAATVVAGCAASAAPAGTPRTIEITVDGYHFVPDHFQVRRGESIRFVVTNPDTIGHELYIGTVAEQAARRAADVAAPSDPASVTHFGYGIYLPAFADGEFDYSFSADTDLLIGCHLPGHWEAGMVATIDVTP
jgi:uncharacterized cupredoxin-like copper-binding protein